MCDGCIYKFVFLSLIRRAADRAGRGDGGERRLICVWLVGGGLLRSLLDFLVAAPRRPMGLTSLCHFKPAAATVRVSHQTDATVHTAAQYATSRCVFER